MVLVRYPALFYSSVKCTGAPKYPYKDILVHRCTSPMNKTTHPYIFTGRGEYQIFGAGDSSLTVCMFCASLINSVSINRYFQKLSTLYSVRSYDCLYYDFSCTVRFSQKQSYFFSYFEKNQRCMCVLVYTSNRSRVANISQFSNTSLLSN